MPENVNDSLAPAANAGSGSSIFADKVHQELFRRKEHDSAGPLVKCVSEAFDFAKGLWQGAIQDPANGAVQVVNHIAEMHLPELHLVDEKNSSIGGIAGKIVGQALDFYALSLATSGFGGAGYIGSTLKMGSVGAAYAGLLQPTDSNSKHFWSDRGINSAVALGTFAGMGATSAALDSTAVFAAPAARSLVGSLAYGGISGLGAGIAHAEANSLATRRRLASSADLLSDSASFALFGTMYGAAGYGYYKLTSPSSYTVASTEVSSTASENPDANSFQADSPSSIGKIVDQKISTRPWYRFKFLPHSDDELDPQVNKAIRDNLDSVVAIVPYKSIGGSKKFMRDMGTGFFVDDKGTIATAQHVVPNDADGSLVIRQNGEIRMADLVKTTGKYDLELLRINPDSPVFRHNSVVMPKAPANETFPAVHLAEDPSLAHGDGVVAIGFPFGRISASPGKFDRLAIPPEFSVSGMSGEQFSNINVGPGNSGSPLFRTSDGAAVGIVTQLFPSTLIRPQQSASLPVNLLNKLLSTR